MARERRRRSRAKSAPRPRCPGRWPSAAGNRPPCRKRILPRGRPGSEDPRPRSQASTSPGAAAATGSEKIVPRLARITLGLNRSVRGSATTRAETPAPSALRSTAPTLPGFSTPSNTATSGLAGKTRSSSRRRPGVPGARPPPHAQPSARWPKASLAKTASLTSSRSPPLPGRISSSRRASSLRHNSGQTKTSRNGHAGGDRPGQFPRPVDQDKLLFPPLPMVPQADRPLDPRIVHARDHVSEIGSSGSKSSFLRRPLVIIWPLAWLPAVWGHRRAGSTSCRLQRAWPPGRPGRPDRPNRGPCRWPVRWPGDGSRNWEA